MKKKKSGVVRQAVKIARDAHILDEHAKALHQSTHNSHQGAKQFHQSARIAKRKVETGEVGLRLGQGLTENDLRRSANEQLAQIALVGNRSALKKKKRA